MYSTINIGKLSVDPRGVTGATLCCLLCFITSVIILGASIGLTIKYDSLWLIMIILASPFIVFTFICFIAILFFVRYDEVEELV